MTRRTLQVAVASFALAAVLQGQPPASQPPASQPYQDAFAEWRKLEPSLAREAATANPQMADRVTRAYAAVTKYTVERSQYLRSLADESGQFLLWIQNSATGGEVDVAPAREEQALVSALTDAVTGNLATYAKDTDRGIVQLRLALEHERAALMELTQAINNRDKAWSKALQLLDPAEEMRGRAMSQYQTLSTGYSSTAAGAEQEGPSWVGYYQALADALSPPGSVAATSGGDAESTPLTIAGVKIVNPANAAPEKVRSTSPELPPVPIPPPSLRAAVVNPVNSAEQTVVTPAVSVSRYLGEWTYPPTGGLFFGVQPESVDLEVHEENGNLVGNLTGRFKVPPGTAASLLLTFAGPLRATRDQIFVAETADGAKGTIELIPGSAFNLLEVNFQTAPREGKLRLVNFVAVRK